MNTPKSKDDGAAATLYPQERFPVKVMGEQRADFAQAVAQLIAAHAPDFDPAQMTQRASSAGRYVSVTATIRATSREQLDALYAELQAHPWVKAVL